MILNQSTKQIIGALVPSISTSNASGVGEECRKCGRKRSCIQVYLAMHYHAYYVLELIYDTIRGKTLQRPPKRFRLL
jgi:hypothetical protein